MDKQLFSTEFTNGYCATVFSQSRFDLKYYVEVFHVSEPQDTHRVDFSYSTRCFLDIYQIFKTINKKKKKD